MAVDGGCSSRAGRPSCSSIALELPEGGRVHEVGTGSGAIALAIVNARPDLRVAASDLSDAAAEGVAKMNAANLALSLDVIITRGLPKDLGGQPDLMLANLPYITESSLFERPLEVIRGTSHASRS